MNKLFTALAFFAFCITFGNISAFAKGDTLTVAVVQPSKSLDPLATTAGVSWGVMSNLYETLVSIENGKIVPRLAESWKILDDGLSYEFTLKEGVKFHNGEIMTADDVVYTFKRAFTPAGVMVKAMSMYLADVRKKDDRTVILKAVSPMGNTFLGSLSHPWASIVNQKAVEARGADYGQYPVGTGKFKIKQWVPDRVAMVKFDDYHGEKAKINNLVFRAIVESTSRTIELESGAVDVIMDVSPTDISRVKEHSGLEIVSIPSYRSYHMGLNVSKAPYDNIKVREALNYALNRPGIAKVVFRGNAELNRGPIPSTIEYNSYKESADIPYDPAKARQLLKEAGFPNGFKTSLLITERSDYQGIATIVQNNLKEIGIDMEIKVSEVGAWTDLVRQPDHDPFLNNWGGNAPSADPFFSLNALFHSANMGQTNRIYYNNPRVDELLDKGVAAPEGKERAAVYAEIWDILNKDLPQLNLFTPLNMYGKVKNLKGIDFSPTVINYFGNAYFE